jgi:hypothetical protein
VDAAEFRERVNATLPNWLYLKLREPEKLTDESRMPTYNFTEQDAAAAASSRCWAFARATCPRRA